MHNLWKKRKKTAHKYSQIWVRNKEELMERDRWYATQQAELANARITLTTQQINPHFVFNTLSAIAALCDVDPQSAQQLTLEFAEYMRGNSVALSSTNPIPFQKELEHTKHYIFIEQTRFGNVFTVDYHLKETDFELPPLTFQPMVENAIKHGIMPKNGGRVVVETERIGKNVILRISDNGVGFDASVMNVSGDNHIGLRNVRQRIELICGGTLDVASGDDCGTMVTITIPQKT